MAYIEFRNIEKFYGSNQVLKGIDLNIEKGQFVTGLPAAEKVRSCDALPDLKR